MVPGWVGLCGEFETWQGVVDELGLSKSKPVSSPATGDGATRCQSDELKPLDEEGKRLYQRIVAKLNYLAHDRLDLKYATSCLANAVSSPSLGDMQAAKRVGRYLRKAPVAWQGFPIHDPRIGELLCFTDADWASDKTSRRSTSGGVVILGGVLNCWAKKHKSVALSSWESELFAAITSGTRSLGIQSELMDLGYSCTVTVATDSQSIVDHSKRRGRSIASNHVGLRGPWLQEAQVDGKLELEKVDTAMNLADVCTKALPGNRIRELCRLARVYACYIEGTMGDDPNEWYLSRLVGCADVRNSNRAAALSLKGRVDFTCLTCCNQTHFAFPVGHEFVNPSFESVLWKFECFRHALVVSVCDVCVLPETLVDSTHFIALVKTARTHCHISFFF